MKVSVVIPNYNGAELLERNLPKVIQVCKNCEIIVVDDASIDGSIKEIKNQIAKIKNTYKKSKIRLLQNEKNLGFASTVNRGVDEASGDLVVLLNTDVIPEKEFLQPSVKHFSNPQVFAVGFLQKCPENGKIIERGRGIGKFQQGFLIHARGAVSRKDTSEVVPMRSGTPQTVEESKKTLWVSGGAGILRKSIWEKLGGLNPLYDPFYWEDIDLSYRALKAGYKVIFEPKSQVVHQQDKGAIRKSYSEQRVKTIAYRNQILFVWLNISDLRYLLSHLFYLPYHLMFSILKRDSTFLKGFILALAKLPEIISHRFFRRKYFRLSDRIVLEDYQS